MQPLLWNRWGRVLIAFVVGIGPPLYAQDSPSPGVAPFFQKKEEGWFWRKQDPLPKPAPKPLPKSEPQVKAEPPRPAASEAKQPFSVAWLRANLPVLLDRAIDKPTPENILAYMYAQRMTLDKAQTFAEATQKVVLADPALDEVGRTSFSTFGRLGTASVQTAARESIIKRLASVGGLWLFYDSTCAYCLSMAESVQQAGQHYGFDTMYISVDHKPLPGINRWVKDQGQAKRFGLKLTPTAVFVVPPNGYFIVSQGVMALDDLMDRILVAAENQNLLTDAEIKSLYPSRNGLLTAQDATEGATNDPVELVTNLRKKIQGNSYVMPLLPASSSK